MIIIIIGLNGYRLTIWRKGTIWACSDLETEARFLSLARGEPGLCSADHGAGYFSNLACGWLGFDWLAPGVRRKVGPGHDGCYFANNIIKLITTVENIVV